ncbi:FAD-dependent monooxygenase [Actinocorallia aurea]
MEGKTVLISGAGVAGIAAAYWLRRHGFAPTVVERAPGIREGGYKVDLRGAALDVAERMGLLDDVRSLRTGVRSGSVVDAAGRKAASMDGDTFGGRVHDDAELLRGDLLHLLHELTKDEVEYLFGDFVTALEETGEGVEATFGSGAVRTFDLVVGADGMRSSTRALVFGPDAEFVRDLGYHISIFSVPNRLGLESEEVTYIGPGRTALAYSTARDTEAKAMLLFASPDSASLESASGRPDRPGAERIVADVYAGEGWEVPKLLADMPASADFYFDSISQVHMDHWSRGRTVLLGDAAYCASPASGQGTSLALVGAYLLAGELASAADHTAAYTAYERLMRPFAEENQKLGPANIKRMVVGSKAGVRLSLATLALMSRLPGKDRIMAKMIAPIHRAATAITLPRY